MQDMHAFVTSITRVQGQKHCACLGSHIGASALQVACVRGVLRHVTADGAGLHDTKQALNPSTTINTHISAKLQNRAALTVDSA